jgi:hypothetical protein
MKIDEVIGSANGKVLCHLIKDASFDEWLTYLFDRPECAYGEHWSHGGDVPEWNVPSELSVDYIARTFENPSNWLRKYSKAQIAAGLEYTWNPAFSDVGSALTDEGIAWAIRKRAIQSLVPLYQECFSRLCSPGLSHLSECLDNPLNGSCYMYWDICWFHGQPKNQRQSESDAECLRVMESTLLIDHDACRESALHGLGHWAFSYPNRVCQIIEQGLKPNEALRAELWSYGQQARVGNVQ